MKGHTKACIHCKKIVLRYCKVRGQGTMELKCPHCHELVEINFSLEPTVKVGKVIPLIILVIFAITTIGTIILYPIGTQQLACNLQQEYNW